MNGRRMSGDSDDAALFSGFGRKLTLLPQPEGDACETQQNDTQIERVAHGNQHGLEGPFDELGHGGDELLKVHGLNLLSRK